MSKHRIAILGSTGSIGQSALSVVDTHADRLEVVGLAAGENAGRLAEQVARYRPRVAAMSTLLNVAVLTLWLLLYLFVFLGVLKPHRTGDRDLVTDLAMTRAQARSGRPRLRFHLAVAAALGLMAALVYLRHR